MALARLCRRPMCRSLAAACKPPSPLPPSSSVTQQEILHTKPAPATPSLQPYQVSTWRAFSAEATPSKVISIKAESEYLSALALAQDNGGVGVVYFTAKWCGPCKMISPVVDELSAKYDKATFLKVDIDQEGLNEVVSDAKVTSVPTFKFYQQSKSIGEIIGASATELKARVAALCNK